MHPIRHAKTIARERLTKFVCSDHACMLTSCWSV